MNKIVRFIQGYLIFGLAIILYDIALLTMPQFGNAMIKGTPTIVLNILGFASVFWIFLFFLYLVMMLVLPSVREQTLRRLANLKERDEREQYITGQASRSAYISTLSLMLFFLFLSVSQFIIEKIPENQKLNDKYQSRMSWSFDYHLFTKDEKTTITQEPHIFNSHDFAPSKATMLLILIGWQLLAFNVRARKEQQDVS